MRIIIEDFSHQPEKKLLQTLAPPPLLFFASNTTQDIMSNDWEQGLCSCFNDCTTCIITYFCACYTIGKNAEAVGDSCCLCGFAHYFFPISLWARVHVRGKIREQKGIRGSCIADLCLVYWCYPCTICQEAQEVKGLSGQAMARE